MHLFTLQYIVIATSVQERVIQTLSLSSEQMKSATKRTYKEVFPLVFVSPYHILSKENEKFGVQTFIGSHGSLHSILKVVGITPNEAKHWLCDMTGYTVRGRKSAQGRTSEDKPFLRFTL